MRKIDDCPEPSELTDWKRCNPGKLYSDINDAPVRKAIRTANASNQYYLCAYCCGAVSGENHDTMNEHVVAQKLDPSRTLDFDNIVASCTTPKQCDAAHKSQDLPLTPLMDECVEELQFMLSGRVRGKSERAKTAIKVLNLGDTEANNRSLIAKRKSFIDALLFENGVDPSEGLDDDELIRMVLGEIRKVKDGKMFPYSPALESVLNSWLSK